MKDLSRGICSSPRVVVSNVLLFERCPRFLNSSKSVFTRGGLPI